MSSSILFSVVTVSPFATVAPLGNVLRFSCAVCCCCYVAGTSRSRKVSEGLNPLLSMMSHTSEDHGGFNIIEEESWKGTNSLYGPAGLSLPLSDESF